LQWCCQAALCCFLAACGHERTQRWEAVTIDGQPASGFVLVTRNEVVIGGHDGCNGWGLADQPGMIVSDAQECAPDPMRDAYRAVAIGREASHTRAGDQLIARAPGHSAVFGKV
jgi:hypothetical protein